MKPHPDFADTDIPRDATVGRFVLTPLAPAQTEEDFAAVAGSEAVLTGVFGSDWPKGLTLQANRTDLAWHDREFTARRSFAWIVRDASGGYLGCAYLYPDIGTTGRGTAVTWIRDMPGRLEVLAELNTAFGDWLAPYLPPGYDLTRVSNDR